MINNNTFETMTHLLIFIGILKEILLPIAQIIFCIATPFAIYSLKNK